MPLRRSPNTISPSFGGLEGSGRRTPERTLLTTSQGRPVTRNRATRASSVPAKKYATKSVPLARTTARGVLRGPPTTGRKDHGAQPAIPSCAGTAARDLLAALTPRSTPGKAVGPVRTLALQRGSPPPRMTPPTPTSIYGVVPGVTATPPLVPAASGSATLTTCTVTVTTCGGPVMSTGFLAGRSATPPARSSPLPTIREVSPCEVVQRPARLALRRKKPPPTSSGPQERRPEGGAAPRTPPTPSSGEEGDSGGPWRTVGRRARSRWSGDSSEGDSPPPAGLHRTPGHSPQEPANTDLAQRMRPCTVVLERSLVRSIREVSASIPQPRTSEDGATGERSGRDNAGHKSVQVSVPGVMGRRRCEPVTGGPGVSGQTPPVNRGGGGEHPRGPRRERLAARDGLVARTETVASIADLEEALLANFFGEDASDVARGGAPGVCDRPDRSRGAQARRGVGGVPARDGDSRGPVREATRLQALYRANRRRAVREVLQGPAESCQLPKQRIQAYFEGLYSELLDTPDVEAERAQPSAEGEGFEYLLDPFTEIEVDRRLRRMTNSASGPDRDLRGAEPVVRLLTAF
ncbi:hypothetical protein ACFW04_011659 [Cataglyphis niger]